MATTLVNFVETNGLEREVSQLQSAVKNTLNPILTKEILDGRFIQDVFLLTGVTNQVQHGLTRPVNGYIVVKKNANSNVWDSESSNTTKTQFLNLICSADVTVSLWVF